MKIKRSSSKKQLHKWTKLGLSLAAVTVLGGLVEPVGLADFGLTKVYAETYVNTSDQPIGVVVYYSGQNLDGTKVNLEGWESYIEVQPGQEIAAPKEFEGYTLISTSYTPPVFSDGALLYVYSQNESIEQPKPVESAGDTTSTDTNTVNYTIQLVDQDGQVLQTIQQSGVEGTEVSFEVPVISGYREGKTEGFDSWTYGKGGTFRLVANKTVKVYYDKAPSIDSLIRPEQRVEYQKVFDEFHTTILKAFEVYKKELGVDDITYEANDLEKIFADSNLSVLHSELVLVQPLFAKPVGLVLTDQDIINAIGWTPEYWDHQIAYHKEIIQKLEKAMANIAASKAIPTVPVDQSITIKAVYTEEQIEPGQKVDVLKEIEYTLNPGESIVLEPLTFEGWTSRVAYERQTVTYEEAKARPNKEYYFYYIEEGTTPTEKPAETPTIDNTTDTANSSVDIAFQEASTRLYNLLMTASRLNPADYTAESYNKGYESRISSGSTESIVTILHHYKEVVNGNTKLENRWDNGASPKAWLTEVYNSDSSVLEQALAGLVAVQQETPSDSSSAGTDEGTTGKTSQTPKDKPAETPVEQPVEQPLETPAKSPAETPTNQPSTDQAGQSTTEPTALSKQESQAGTASPTSQSAPGKEETKEETKEQAAPASQSKQSTDKPAPTSQPQAKTLPATGEASSILHLTGLGLLGLAGLVVKKRSGKSS
ncbi:TPA: LPXTG cell wall anchor domain-containing protein [Streptococcus suis]|nr:LPXTG cell wall anchor domain-containing protein [Streptococcus suis]